MPFLSELPNVLSASLEACCEPDSNPALALTLALALALALSQSVRHYPNPIPNQACCEPDSIRGFDVREARAAMHTRREQLSEEKRRTQQLLRTFLHVRTTLGGAMPSK